MKVQTKDIAFRPEELTTCKKCSRENPPTRLDCLYCGNDLDVSANDLHSIKSVPRELESWEPGFNVIINPRKFATPNEAAVATLTGLSEKGALAAFSAERPLPVARVSTELDARMMVAALAQIGFEAMVLSDDVLGITRPPHRIRSIEFLDDTFNIIEFNGDICRTLAYEDVTLLVSGIISESVIEHIEKKRRGKQTEVLNESETESGQPVLDIYVRSDNFGYRIMLTGFDFSCLGDNKGLIASKNLQKLILRIRELCPKLHFSDDHIRYGAQIAAVWPPDSQRDSRGMQRSGFANFGFASRISSSNLRQFNLFSRLERYLYETSN